MSEAASISKSGAERRISGGARSPLATRLRAVALAGLGGWLAGFLASVPAQAVVAYRDSEGDPRMFVETLGMGLAVWGIFTLLLAAAAWLVAAVPVALWVKPAILLRLHQHILVVAGVCAAGLVAVKMYRYRNRTATKLAMKFFLFMPYGAFAMFFAVVTAWLYVRLMARHAEQAAA